METAQKKIVLENAIAYYIQQGYRVSSQTENTAQLVKPKQFSLGIAIVLLILLIVPFLIYLLYYFSQTDKSVYIVVDEEGIASITDERGQIAILNNDVLDFGVGHHESKSSSNNQPSSGVLQSVS